MPKAQLIEIFCSIQGEGLWLGREQVFVRFKGCKLQCEYCDTPLTHMKIQKARIENKPYTKKFISHNLEFSIDELNEIISRFEIPSIAITGGEPLEQIGFIKEWLPTIKNKFSVLLETSGVEVGAFSQIAHVVDMVSMDIKIPSSTKEKSYWEEHRQFLNKIQNQHYAKIVFDENITDEEIFILEKFINDYPKTIFIFQPVSPIQKRDLSKILSIFHQFSKKFPDQTRLVPQMHKVLQVM